MQKKGDGMSGYVIVGKFRANISTEKALRVSENCFEKLLKYNTENMQN